MNKWIAEFDLEDGDIMPEHMDLNYKGAKIDFHCRPMWTSISEKLPEEKEDVLIQYRTGGVDKMAVSSRIDYNYWVGFGRDICVTAWQPLPAPYKANNEEKS